MMSLLSFFAIVVLAAETVISPIPDDIEFTPQPSLSFGTLATPPPSVLGTMTETTPTPTPVTYRARSKHYTIALLGDSMIDTLGPAVPNLKNKLSALYPQTKFTILNYGVGGTNIDYGVERLTTEYSYLGKTIPPLLSVSPDVVVIESFGYNPYTFEEGALEKHWLQLARIVDSVKAKNPGVKIIIASTIAPNSKTFGDGAPGLSFSPDDKLKRTNIIKGYLDSTVKFAQSQRLPLADAYHASMDKNGDGSLTYINGGDHIHYSGAGRDLFAQKVADAIIQNKLLE